MFKIMTLTCTALLLAGCTEPEVVTEKRGLARQVVFVQCMELAAKMPRQSDDDVADIVSTCGDQSYYLTNYIK
jgi:hypothetical protein